MLEEIHNVEKILDKKWFGRRFKYLIKWEGHSEDHATWEPIENLQNLLTEIRQFEESMAQGKKKKNLNKNTESESSEKEIKNIDDNFSGKKRERPIAFENTDNNSLKKMKFVEDDQIEEEKNMDINLNENEKNSNHNNQPINKEGSQEEQDLTDVNPIKSKNLPRAKQRRTSRIQIKEPIAKSRTSSNTVHDTNSQTKTDTEKKPNKKLNQNSIKSKNNFNLEKEKEKKSGIKNKKEETESQQSDSEEEEVRPGSFEEGDIPIKIIKATQHNVDKHLLLCELEWKQVGEIKPRNSIYTNREIKMHNPVIMCNYYESKMVAPKKKI
jgi:hypothetical protein